MVYVITIVKAYGKIKYRFPNLGTGRYFYVDKDKVESKGLLHYLPTGIYWCIMSKRVKIRVDKGLTSN